MHSYIHTSAASCHLCTSLAEKWELKASLKREKSG
jgi:hypothetical protein